LKTQHKIQIGILLIGILLGSIITYTLAQTGNTFIISTGVYPRPSSYTIFEESSIYYAKNDYGLTPLWSGTTNKTLIIENARDDLTNGGTIFLHEVLFNASITLPDDILVIEEYQGRRTLYPPKAIPSITVTSIDLLYIENACSVDLANYQNDHMVGIGLDVLNKVFYVSLPNTLGGDNNRASILLKIDQTGQIIAYRNVTNRRYAWVVLANNYKLYGVESSENTSDTFNPVVDELSTTDLSLTQNIVTFTRTNFARIRAWAKASDSELCLIGGLITISTNNARYSKVNLVTKTKTIYTAGECDILLHGIKVDDDFYIYSYEAPANGSFYSTINLNDWSFTHLQNNPIAYNQYTPLFEYEGKILWGEAGNGGQTQDQELYWYDIELETWTEISNYPLGTKKHGYWGGIYFQNIEKALLFIGQVQGHNYPSNEFMFNPATEHFVLITHEFDGLWNTVNYPDNSTMTINRLSSGSRGCGRIDDDSFGGENGNAFQLRNHYVFLLPMVEEYNITAPYHSAWRPHLVFGILEP